MAYVYVDDKRCAGCGTCVEVCPTRAIAIVSDVATIDQERCDACQTCVDFCPNGAILVVTEAVEEKAMLPSVQPRSRVAPGRPAAPIVPLGKQLVPLVGSALVFWGREVVPRLIPRLVNALDRHLSQRWAGGIAPASVPGGKPRGGFRFRRRRRGG